MFIFKISFSLPYQKWIVFTQLVYLQIDSILNSGINPNYKKIPDVFKSRIK